MAARGVSGTAVGLATAGGLLLYSALKGVAIPDALRQVISSGTLPAGGTPVPGGAAGPAAPGASTSALTVNQAVATDALRYAGKVPYRWGGADPSGWDCSGFVTWVLVHDLGYTLPSASHTVCMQFYSWGGAYKVASPQPGDLVVWPTHMGIAVSATEMVSAMNPKQGTAVTTFAAAGLGTPTFMRLKTGTVT